MLVCDDDAILSDAVATLIGFTPNLEMVAPPVHTAQHAIDTVTRHHPDVVVMDIDLVGGMDGFQATTHIKAVSPATNVVIMSGTTHQDTARQRARDVGASTFLTKTGFNAELIAAIRAAAAPHGTYWPELFPPAR